MPGVRYFPHPWPAYVLAYDEGRAEDLAAVVRERWHPDDGLYFLCLRCGVVWSPSGAPPPCEHLTYVRDARRAAHIDSPGLLDD